jgi:hypothetical protein
MPTKREREYYRMGFSDGYKSADIYNEPFDIQAGLDRRGFLGMKDISPTTMRIGQRIKKRKLSAWQKYIKNKRNHIKYRDGKLNLKKMGVEYRRSKRR